jgi:hypothetical protein
MGKAGLADWSCLSGSAGQLDHLPLPDPPPLELLEPDPLEPLSPDPLPPPWPLPAELLLVPASPSAASGRQPWDVEAVDEEALQSVSSCARSGVAVLTNKASTRAAQLHSPMSSDVVSFGQS